ncbi:hypothetical protein LOAG_11099 [Loa loa]|uniref:Secreted protein n=1 Tax=Loa loa TaxID=7209 RepID=A0A1S0TNP3_LOALO|nr:hypothetical protein LOAG_11099 [Loa loa]EFO17400.1 hypothetical protein LOAG_11099 [Loa loa]
MHYSWITLLDIIIAIAITNDDDDDGDSVVGINDGDNYHHCLIERKMKRGNLKIYLLLIRIMNCPL